MTKSRNRIRCGDFDALREVVEFTGIAGRWVETENHCQFRTVSRAVLNYWKTTGTITFQGPDLAAAELKAVFLKRAVLDQAAVMKDYGSLPVLDAQNAPLRRAEVQKCDPVK